MKKCESVGKDEKENQITYIFIICYCLNVIIIIFFVFIFMLFICHYWKLIGNKKKREILNCNKEQKKRLLQRKANVRHRKSFAYFLEGIVEGGTSCSAIVNLIVWEEGINAYL